MNPQFNIKRWRQARGINQKWLGFLMGLPQQNMNRIENGACGFTRVQFHLFLAVKVIIENGHKRTLLHTEQSASVSTDKVRFTYFMLHA